MKKTAHAFKALADETRLRILALLTGGELCVCDLTAVLDLPQSTVSRHLAYLRHAGWVDDRRCGIWMYYRLKEREEPICRDLLRLLRAHLTDGVQAEIDRLALANLRREKSPPCNERQNPDGEDPELKRVLFLCTGNSCRSQMADGIVNHDFAGRIEAFSAGTEPHGINPKAVRVMAEIGIDISSNSSDHISRYEGETFDYVITLCGDANEKCPLFFGGVKRLHMGFEDPPKATGTEEEVLNVYRRVRDEIRAAMREFFEQELT